MALRMLVDKATGFAAKHYQKALANRLQQTGLRFEDILNDDDGDVKEALSLADSEILTGRNRRIKRAIDLSFKRKNMMDYAPDMEQDTFKKELYEDVEKIRARDQEYALLNTHNK